MALLDFLKRKKEIEKAKKPEKKAAAASAAPESRKDAENPPAGGNAERRGNENKKAGKFSYNIVKEPHISEKATNLTEKNKYTFKVYTNSNKQEIKKSVEGIYGVNVLDVNIIKAPHKKRRLGRTEGFKKAFKKALVTIRPGQKIEIF